MFTKSLIGAGLVGLALCTLPAAAHAAPGSADARNVQHRQVNYADLDLSTTAGQARLDARLRHAAATVCEANYGPQPLSEALEARRCYREALQSARSTMASLGTAQQATIKIVSR